MNGIFIALVLALLAWIFISAAEFDQQFTAWSSDCREKHGIVQNVTPTRYECFIDGKKVVLPGWEKYQ